MALFSSLLALTLAAAPDLADVPLASGARSLEAGFLARPGMGGNGPISKAGLLEATVGARVDDLRIELRLEPLAVPMEGARDPTVTGYLLAGFESADIALLGGLGKVGEFGAQGGLSEGERDLAFAWRVRFGGRDSFSLSLLGAHQFPDGPMFAALDATLQVPIRPVGWLLARAGTQLGGYAVREVGMRWSLERVTQARRPVYLVTTVGLMSLTHDESCEANPFGRRVTNNKGVSGGGPTEYCSTYATHYLPSLGLGLEWR